MILKKLLNRLGLVPKSEYDEIAERLKFYRATYKGDITIFPSCAIEVIISAPEKCTNVRRLYAGDVANMEIEPGYTRIEIRR